MQEWPHQSSLPCHAFVSPHTSSSNPSNGSHLDLDDFLTHLAWDQATADGFNLIDPTSTTAASFAADLSSFPTTDLDLDYNPLDSFATPLFDYYPASLPVPPLTSSASTSVDTTPVTTLLPSPSPAPPSPDGPALFPGLKLPQQRKPSKPGRRPAGASLTRTTDGRVTKRSAATEELCPHDDEDEDPEVVSRRYRNNLAAKRYRQKKIDRIQELEEEVKEVKQERDDLRIKLARQEAEIAALREMLKMKHGGEGTKD